MKRTKQTNDKTIFCFQGRPSCLSHVSDQQISRVSGEQASAGPRQETSRLHLHKLFRVQGIAEEVSATAGSKQKLCQHNYESGGKMVENGEAFSGLEAAEHGQDGRSARSHKSREPVVSFEPFEDLGLSTFGSDLRRQNGHCLGQIRGGSTLVSSATEARDCYESRGAGQAGARPAE